MTGGKCGLAELELQERWLRAPEMWQRMAPDLHSMEGVERLLIDADYGLIALLTCK